MVSSSRGTESMMARGIAAGESGRPAGDRVMFLPTQRESREGKDRREVRL